jgi:hypothetical protein
LISIFQEIPNIVMNRKFRRTAYYAFVGFFPVFLIIQLGFALAEVELSNSLYVGMSGAAGMHGDMRSSDTTPLMGPGIQEVDVQTQYFFSACPTILIRSDGKPFVLSTNYTDRKPIVRLLKKRNGKEKARLELEAGSLLGGVYAYLDNEDRLVMVDGNHKLIRIKAQRIEFMWFRFWILYVDEGVSLVNALTESGREGGDDKVVAISAGINGTVWFVTNQSLVGIYNPNASRETTSIKTIKLADQERVDNSFSTTDDGFAAIVTNKALYLLNQNEYDQPQVLWRYEYDAGTFRKPGQLSHGSGATPTFFGPGTGTEFVMITDNGDYDLSLIVLNTVDGQLICKKSIFTDLNNYGTENSAIGIGRSAIVSSTYGYPYPVLPEGAGPSEPEHADFIGGMVRVDLNECDFKTDCYRCDILWENDVRSAAVPKLSTADGFIYTIERLSPNSENKTTLLDTYHFTVIDSETGEILKQTQIGTGPFSDTLQMAGNVGTDGIFWQGNIGGIVRISPKN